MADHGLTVEEIPRSAPQPSAHRRRRGVRHAEQLDLLAGLVPAVPPAERDGTAPFNPDSDLPLTHLDLATVDTWLRHGLPADDETRAFAVYLLVRAVNAYEDLAAVVDELLGVRDA